ncbi:unnamed protein product [Albugo candida]|uniref:Uncharacterized protein n=1 Tax=Albugo candida TaxID=65357 RepID=A0A024GPK6_9STRA|nr:unnamed protein product [Albugo candida]|eukprot:CCI48438.1 unnamed protein product [Albugo candida]
MLKHPLRFHALLEFVDASHSMDASISNSCIESDKRLFWRCGAQHSLFRQRGVLTRCQSPPKLQSEILRCICLSIYSHGTQYDALVHRLRASFSSFKDLPTAMCASH